MFIKKVLKKFPKLDVIVRKLRLFYNLRFNKRVPFTYEGVVSGYKYVNIPAFSARLYKEVNLLKEASERSQITATAGTPA